MSISSDQLDRPDYRLSPREAEVLMALALGLTHREAARQLGISENTVRNHAVSLRASLGALSMAHAVHPASQQARMAWLLAGRKVGDCMIQVCAEKH